MGNRTSGTVRPSRPPPRRGRSRSPGTSETGVQAPRQEAVGAPGTRNRSRTMIVDSAHYKDGARQHEAPLTLERAAELAKGAGAGEFVWIGIHEPEACDLDRAR